MSSSHNLSKAPGILPAALALSFSVSSPALLTPQSYTCIHLFLKHVVSGKYLSNRGGSVTGEWEEGKQQESEQSAFFFLLENTGTA